MDSLGSEKGTLK